MFGRRFPNAGDAVEYLRWRTAENRIDEPRRKFVEGHQLIHDRKKSEPCIPILPGHDQEGWFAKLDSHGIWKMVFDYITNPSDMSNAYYSCEMFRKYLERKRKMALLPKVFEVLRDTGRMNYSGFKDFTSGEKKKESLEILRQRLVSKAWKKAVEETFLLPVNLSPSQPIWRPEKWNWESPMVCDLAQVEHIKYAMEKLENAEMCANLVRMIGLDDAVAAFLEQDAYYAKPEQFLAHHGESVWGLHAICYYLNYEKLCRIVSKMANLKFLALYTYRGLEGDTEEGSNARLRQMLHRNPFPFLSSLQFCVLQTEELIKAEILSKSLNLMGVRMGHKKQGNHNHIEVFPQSVWNALHNLRLEYLYLEYESWEEDVFRDDLLYLEQFQSPLKILHFDLVPRIHRDRNVNIRSSLILPVLNRFNDSLIEFSFKINEHVNFNLINDGESFVGDFPKLKTLQLPCIKIRAV